MNISGFGGFNPAQMQQQMQDKFNKADVDGSGGMSLEEMTNAAPEGMNAAKMEKVFNKMDANGDGEVSQEEHSAMMQAMQERMQSISGGLSGYPTGNSDANQQSPFAMMLQALSEDQEEDSDAKQELDALMEKLQSEGKTSENMHEASRLIKDLVPNVNVTA